MPRKNSPAHNTSLSVWPQSQPAPKTLGEWLDQSLVATADGDKGDITLSGGGTVWTIDNDTISNAKLANMAEATIKLRAKGAGTGDPIDGTGDQARAIVNLYVINPQYYGAVGDGAADDTAELQAAIDAAEALETAGGFGAVVDLEGRAYGISDELTITEAVGIRNGKLIALSSSVWSTSPYSASDIHDLIRTNLALWNRDLTNAAWVKTNTTAVKDQTGIDGTANSASKITSSAANGTTLQSITSASATRVFTAFLKRITGTGNIQMTVDGGGTWTTCTPALDSTFRQYTITQTGVTNPQVGFRIVTNGDAVAVDYVQLETADQLAISTPPMLTTTAAVTRTVSSKFLIKMTSTSSHAFVRDVEFECSNLCGGVLAQAIFNVVDRCRFENVAGIGIRQDEGGQRIINNTLSSSIRPFGRNGIGIYAGAADGKFINNISRYNAYPLYLGKGLTVSTESGSTGLYVNNHFYNGDSTSNPDSTIMYFYRDAGAGVSANSNNFVGNYLDNGAIHIQSPTNSFYSNRVAWGNNNASALFHLWTEDAAATLSRFLFGGLQYPKATFTTLGIPVFRFRAKASGDDWTGLNAVLVGTAGAGTPANWASPLTGSAMFHPDVPAFVSDGSNLGEFYGTSTTALLRLFSQSTVDPPEIGANGDDMVLRTNGIERIRLGETGIMTHTLSVGAGEILINDQTSGMSSKNIQGSRASDTSAFAEIRVQNRAGTGSVTGEAAWRFHRNQDNDAVLAVLELEDAAGTAQDHLQASEDGMQGIYKTVVLTGNANFTLTSLGNKTQIFHTGTLSANRTVTLATTDVNGNAIVDGASFRITRTGGGAFTLDVGSGPLKSLATNTWGEFVWDKPNTQWRLAKYGAL